MKIDEVKGGWKEYKGKCHDCGKEVKVIICKDEETGAVTIEGGAVYNPLVGMPPVERIYLKCDACYKENRVLLEWQECEVYSRVVGYLRPVNQWNTGKKEEFGARNVFKIG